MQNRLGDNRWKMKDKAPLIDFFDCDSLARSVVHRHELRVVGRRTAIRVALNLIIPKNHIVARDFDARL